MLQSKIRLLQLFAEGGEGGGEGMGESAVDATQQEQTREDRLAELGVPQDKIRRRSKAPVAETAPVVESADNSQDETATAGEAPQSQRMSWKQIMEDPEYNKEMQKTIQSRLKASKATEDKMAKVAPMLEVLSNYYGVDPNDIDALTGAFSSDDHYYEDKAIELGVPVETARRLDQLERSEQKRQEEQQQTFQQQAIANHLQGLQSQAEELKKTFPSFDLQAELQNNEAFRRLTAPGVGISVQDAYYAVHRAEIQAAQAQVTAQTVAQKMSKGIASGSRRPVENGAGSQAPSVTTSSYRNMSKAQRDELKARIRRGERIIPGR